MGAPARTAVRERLDYADALRICGVVAVVSVHACGVRVMSIDDVDSATWWMAEGIDSLSRFAVPVFVMLSGALLLNPAHRDTVTDFYLKRVSRIAVPLVFWTAFYFWWSGWYRGEPVTQTSMARSLWDGLTENHLYYLFIIAGLYAVTPLIRPAVKGTRAAALAGGLAMLWLASSGLLLEWVPMNAATRFLPYVSYFILGYALRDARLFGGAAFVLLLVFAVVTGIIIVGTHQLVSQYGRDDYRAFALYDHFSPVVAAQSLLVFIGLQQLSSVWSREPVKTLLQRFAPAVFGMYLAHVVFLDVLHAYTSNLGDELMLAAIVFEIAGALMLSAIATFGLMRMPYARAIVGG